MYSTIQVNDFSPQTAFVVPSIAIKQDIKGNYLYVATGKRVSSKPGNGMLKRDSHTRIRP